MPCLPCAALARRRGHLLVLQQVLLVAAAARSAAAAARTSWLHSGQPGILLCSERQLMQHIVLALGAG